MDEGYTLTVAVPSVSDYLRLRIAAGLSAKTAAGAAVGLANTWFGVVIEKNGEAVGMGRVVGDGGLFFQVVDMAVAPEHQGRGLGRAIFGALTDRLRRSELSGAYVSLIADGEAHRLYAQFGFRLTAPNSVGMAWTIE